MEKHKGLFLCTGKSCQSQMAEANVNAQLGKQWQAFSAGTQLIGYKHPQASAAFAEIGIQYDRDSKLADEFRSVEFELVVTACDDVAENCPVWLGKVNRIHLGFTDPAKAQGSYDEIIQVFRSVRDIIERKNIENINSFTS